MLLDLCHYAKLTDVERGLRFADFCDKAIVSFYRNELAAAKLARVGMDSAKTLDPTMLIRDAVEREIVRYLVRVGAAKPTDFQKALGIPRTTLTRKLRLLLASGLVAVSGRTRAARYCLRGNSGLN